MYNFRATHTLTPQLLIHQNHWTSQKWHRRISLFGAIGVDICSRDIDIAQTCQALRYDCQFTFHYLQAAYFYQP